MLLLMILAHLISTTMTKSKAASTIKPSAKKLKRELGSKGSLSSATTAAERRGLPAWADIPDWGTSTACYLFNLPGEL